MKFCLVGPCRIGMVISVVLASSICISAQDNISYSSSDPTNSSNDGKNTRLDRVDAELDAALSAHLPPSRGPIELPIDLPTVLKLSGTDPLEIQLATERVNEARAHTLESDFKFLPRLEPQFNNVWHHGEVQSTTGNFSQANKQSALEGVALRGNWAFGELIYSSLAARKRQLASQEALNAVSDESKIVAVNSFFNLVLARSEQAIVEDRLKQADETVRLADTMMKRGAGLLSEVKRAEAARAEVQQRLASAKEQVRFASLGLTQALHIDPLVTLVPQQQPQDVINLVKKDEITELVSDAMIRRPELAEARAQWGALDKERKAAIIGPLIPTIHTDVFAGAFGRHPGTAVHAQDYGIGIYWAIGPGGIGDISRRRIAESRQKQESIQYGVVADQVVNEVVQNQTHVHTSREQIELAKQEVAAAEEALKLSQERLKNGSALTIEVLAAEDQLFSAKSRAVLGINEFNKAQYGLLRSIGGFRGTDTVPADSNQ